MRITTTTAAAAHAATITIHGQKNAMSSRLLDGHGWSYRRVTETVEVFTPDV